VTQTLLGLATDALHDDFDTTKYATRAKGFVATAVDMVYRTTSLARGDYAASQTLAAGAGSLSVAVTGLRVSSVSLTDTGELLSAPCATGGSRGRGATWGCRRDRRRRWVGRWRSAAGRSLSPISAAGWTWRRLRSTCR
jgi:hypothetical protein